MPTSLCSALCLSLTLVVAAPASTAWADGLPLPVDASATGVVSERGNVRFVTAETKGRTTVIAQAAASGGVLGSTLLDGRFTVPLVAYDGSAGGISADGRTLVLIRPRRGFPRGRTSFAVLDHRARSARRLRLRRTIRLKGDFSYDALSTDGRSLFLIHYISRRDATRYRVRVYDLRTGRLDPDPIVDPRESPDEMNGLPLSRAASPGGRWAYTLYDGNGGHPFIHALDTRDRRAVCIDLDHLSRADNLMAMKLEVDGSSGEVSVLDAAGPVAVVDTRTFDVTVPVPASSRERDEAAGDGPPLAAAAGAVAAIAGGLVLLLRRRRRRSARLYPGGHVSQHPNTP